MNSSLLFTMSKTKISITMEDRIFIPGSEWLYFKIYTGTKTGDDILKNEVYDFVHDLRRKNIIDQWFFVRYNDPDFHLRLRLHINNTCNLNYVFELFFKKFTPLLDSGFIWNIQCDTYLREIERYGANSILLIENLFFLDSKFIIKLLRALDNNGYDDERWEMSLVLIDSFFSAFSLSINQRKEVLDYLSKSFKKEFGFTYHQMTKPLNDKYRFYRKKIDEIMLWENRTTEVINIIRARMFSINIIAEQLIALEHVNKLQVSIRSLLESLIHMTMNRWFKSKNRQYEMVVYDFLFRYYTSKIKRIENFT